MACTVNDATGEVSVTLGEVDFVLHATMPNVAALQAAIKVPGLRMLNMLLTANDARIAYEGMKCLCTSGNAPSLDTMLFTPICVDALEAVSAALDAGLPNEDDGDGESTGKP